jgi:hypothetical protein
MKTLKHAGPPAKDIHKNVDLSSPWDTHMRGVGMPSGTLISKHFLLPFFSSKYQNCVFALGEMGRIGVLHKVIHINCGYRAGQTRSTLNVKSVIIPGCHRALWVRQKKGDVACYPSYKPQAGPFGH